jgi:hypothetical protein
MAFDHPLTNLINHWTGANQAKSYRCVASLRPIDWAVDTQPNPRVDEVMMIGEFQIGLWDKRRRE